MFLRLRKSGPLRPLPILAIALAMAGCSLLRGTPPETYDLTGPQAIPRLPGGTTAQMLVPEPSALKILDSDKIVVAAGPRLYYYPDAQWPDRMPRVFQARAIEAFENSRKATAVGRPGEGLSIDYQIIANIRSFEYRVTSDTGGYAHVEVYVKIMDDTNGRIVATRTLTGDATVARGTASEVVAGLDAAMSEVLIELVRWTLGVV